MEPETITDFLSRWIHVGAAIVMLGGSVYLRWVVMPAAMELPEAELIPFRERLKSRARKIIMVGILLLLLTGFYNYVMVGAPSHTGENKGVYHALMGVKMLLALGLFFLASVLAGRSAKFEGLREKSPRWLTILVLLGALVVAIGSYLKVAVPPSAPPVEEPPVTLFYSADEHLPG
jgi:uncharacterized membrane protein